VQERQKFLFKSVLVMMFGLRIDVGDGGVQL
jgi:hypothetical protein